MVKKITKQELEKPDLFQVAQVRITKYISDNKSKIYITLGIIVLILATSAGWYLYRTNYEDNAQKLYTKAHNATLQSRRAGANIDQNTIKLYQDVVSQYPGTKSAAITQYRLGNLYYQLNDFDTAIKAYMEFLKIASDGSELTTLAYMGLGYCHESKKDFKNALESFEKAASTKSAGNFESVNYRNIARMYEELNNKEKAIEYYQKALGKTGDPSIEQLIKRKISSIG